MLQKIFFTIFNMSIAAGYCAILVVVVRLFMKKLPKSYSYALWVIVFVRLMLPVVPETSWSLIPDGGVFSEEILHTGMLEEQASDAEQWVTEDDRQQNVTVIGQTDVDLTFGNLQVKGDSQKADSQTDGDLTAGDGSSVNLIGFFSKLWLVGSITLIGYGVLVSIFFKRRLKGAVQCEKGIYELENLPTAFVAGVIKPRIYLPAGLPEEYRRYVLVHEQTHVQRGDIQVKYITYFFTSIHWFNPLMWISFSLMCRDMEMSCDERVLRSLGMAEKKAYSTALLSVASGRKLELGMPVAFSENDAKGRIKNVLNYQKPTLWVTATAVVVLIVLALGLLSDPREERMEEEVTTESEATSESEVTSESETKADSEKDTKTESEIYKLITPEYLAEVEQWIEFKARPSDMGFSRWFWEYCGPKLQNLIDYDGEKFVTLPEGVVFYQTEEDEWIGDTVRKMLDTSVELSIMEIEKYAGRLWLVEYEEDVYFLMNFQNTYRLQRFEEMKTYKEKEVELAYVPIYPEDLQDKELLAEKLSAGVNAVFLCREYENVMELNPVDDSGIVFDFTRGFREDGIVDYYFDEETYCQAMARKMGQNMSEFLVGHNLVRSPYGKIYHGISGDTMYREFEVTDVKWLDDSQAEIHYSSTYHNGVVIMKEHEGEMIFVSHRNIRESN